ncbi:putative secreted protein (Por secretion system target) [Kordia periserrulae]|uniref:Putative secreted protein (Por secretion system target) n=1 Tax=Kordia periserrulae TaxID=701523 RepID=A0A2T6C466_9FLAO|nr:T9SS type A sorting domain-containing protein [Kordia periserrulae]PTX63098.1 putative secreted protein (Por secretion system target) [Kordia periserrulae]
MKIKILCAVFLQCFVISLFGQNDKYIQIELVDTTIINSYVGAPTYYYDMPPGATDYSNDAGLNAILDGNNVYAYDTIESIPSPFVYGAGFSHWTLVVCDDCDHNQLAANLNAYSSVIKNAYPLIERYSYNQLYLRVADVTIGVYTGMNNGIVTTNDAGLNAIFTTHNVTYYEQAFPSSSQNTLLRAYFLMCDCDANLLKVDLDNYPSVIESGTVSNLPVESQLLSTAEVTLSNVNLYPNPVKNTLNISSATNLNSIEVYSVQGQLMLTQKNQFTTVDMSPLKSGLYFVKLIDNANNSSTFKIVKN